MLNLKRFSVLAVVIGLSLPIATAQFSIGPRLGVNLASMSTNVAGSESSSIMGIAGGLTTRALITKNISFGGDALFSQLGNKATTVVTTAGTTVTTKQTTKISYIQVPVYINFEIPFKPKKLVPYRVKESFTSAHLYAGGYFGYALGATVGSDVETLYSDGTPRTNVNTPSGAMDSKNYNAVDFGLMLGAGFSFRLDDANKQRMFLDFRYFLGMSDFDAFAATSAKNTPLSISVAYQYKTTKRIYTNRK